LASISLPDIGSASWSHTTHIATSSVLQGAANICQWNWFRAKNQSVYCVKAQDHLGMDARVGMVARDLYQWFLPSVCLSNVAQVYSYMDFMISYKFRNRSFTYLKSILVFFISSICQSVDKVEWNIKLESHPHNHGDNPGRVLPSSETLSRTGQSWWQPRSGAAIFWDTIQDRSAMHEKNPNHKR
jgi:hypothetical protein